MSTDQEANVDFRDIRQLKPADFESQLNTDFAVDLKYCGIVIDGTPVRRDDVYPADARLTLKLVEVKRKPQYSSRLREDPFVLLFCGSHVNPLYDETHVLEHESLGKIVLYMTTVNTEPGILAQEHPDGLFYEAVIG